MAAQAVADTGTITNFRGLTSNVYTTYYMDLSATVDTCPTDGRYCGWFPVTKIMPTSETCLTGYNGTWSSYVWVGPSGRGNSTVSGSDSVTTYSFSPGPQPWRICTYIYHSGTYVPVAQWTYSAADGLVAGPAPETPPGYVPPNQVPNPNAPVNSPSAPTTPTTPASPSQPVHQGPPTVASVRYGTVMRVRLSGLDGCREGTLRFEATSPRAKKVDLKGDSQCGMDGISNPRGEGIRAYGMGEYIDLQLDGRARRTVTRAASWRLSHNGTTIAEGRVQLRRKYTPPRKGRGYKIWSDTNFDDFYNICLDGDHNTYSEGGRIYCWETTRYPRSAKWTDSTRKLK